MMKTEALKAGARQVRLRRRVRRRAARRGEEPRQGAGLLVPHRRARLGPASNQRPELWHLYNTRIAPGETMRVFPLSNWTELDVWDYIVDEDIPVVPLYFAKERPVVSATARSIMVDDDRLPLQPGETPQIAHGALPHARLLSADRRRSSSSADDHRGHRRRDARRAHIGAARPADRHDESASMEKKKREGYF